MGDETTLHEAIINLERRVNELDSVVDSDWKVLRDKINRLQELVKSQQMVLEILMKESSKNQQNPDCAVDPTGEWY